MAVAKSDLPGLIVLIYISFLPQSHHSMGSVGPDAGSLAHSVYNTSLAEGPNE
jgi:hypothetical protein